MMRTTCPQERVYIDYPEMVQLAMKMMSPSLVPLVLENVKAASVGLRLRIDGYSIAAHNNPYEIVQIPKYITETEEASNWLYENATPDSSQTMATVGVNDDMVVLNSHHLCADGGFLRYLYKNCTRPDFRSESFSALPRALTDIFADQIRAINFQTPFTPASQLSRVWWRHPKIPHPRTDYAKFAQWTCPVSSLQCYDKKSKKCVGLTERLWTALSLSTSAFNSVISKNFGVLTCVDLRFVMKPEAINVNVCNNFVLLAVVPKGLSEKSTIQEIGDAMRKDFSEKQKKGGFFIIDDPERAARHGQSLVALSNMGAIEVMPPFKDVWMQQTMRSMYAETSLCFLSWSKINGNRSDFWGRLRYSPNSITESEADALGKSIAYVLEKFHPSTPADVAIRELIKVQKACL